MKSCSLFSVLTLASVQFSIVRTHVKEYIIYAQSSENQNALNSREKGKSLSTKIGQTVRAVCRAAALTPNS